MLSTNQNSVLNKIVSKVQITISDENEQVKIVRSLNATLKGRSSRELLYVFTLPVNEIIANYAK